MKTQKSFKWLFERLIPNKQIKVCDFDRESLIQIAESLNKINTTAFQENTIFAKMMVYCFIHELEFYKDVNFAEKKLNEILETPLELHYKKFQESLNRLELQKFHKSIGLSQKHPFEINIDETKKDNDIIKENQIELTKYLNGIIREETVFKTLNNTITNLITNYKNLN